MKTIQCDICKRILGKTVDTGDFHTITTANYRPTDFDSGFYFQEKKIADICTECCNEVMQAQKDAVEKIKSRLTPTQH